MTKDTVIIMTLLESSNSNSNFFRRIVFRSFFCRQDRNRVELRIVCGDSERIKLMRRRVA